MKRFWTEYITPILLGVIACALISGTIYGVIRLLNVIILFYICLGGMALIIFWIVGNVIIDIYKHRQKMKRRLL